jgi:hypothetical protein
MLKKPNQKTITDAGITAVAFVAGAKVSDGVAAIMPESTASYKRWGLAAAGIVLAASISGTTTTAKAAQSAALGMAAKQLYDEVNIHLKASVAQKTGTTAVDKFTNALVGHGLGTPDYYLGAAWESNYNNSQVWDRPADAIPAGFDATLMM